MDSEAVNAALMQAMQAFGEQLLRGVGSTGTIGNRSPTSRSGSPTRGSAATRQRQDSDKDFGRCDVFSGDQVAWRRKFRTAMKAAAYNVDEALGWVAR